MSNAWFLPWLARRKKEVMMIGILLLSIDVEEASNRFVIAVHQIRRCQPNHLSIPVIHHFVANVLRIIGHTIVPPPIDRCRTGLEPLESTLARFTVLVVYHKLFKLQRVGCAFCLTMYQVDMEALRISEPLSRNVDRIPRLVFSAVMDPAEAIRDCRRFPQE